MHYPQAPVHHVKLTDSVAAHIAAEQHQINSICYDIGEYGHTGS